MEEFTLDTKMLEKLKTNSFDAIFSALNLRSEETVKSILFAVAKLAFWREKRFNRPLTNKDITFLLKTAHFHATKRTQLNYLENKLLPKNISEQDAQLYFIDHMTSKQIFDIFERKIIIPDSAVDCFYKDEITGKHKVQSEYYRIYRARRLPWVIPNIENSQEVYIMPKPKYKCEEFFYISVVDIPYPALSEEENIIEKHYRNYFIAMARRKYDMKELEFVTEYPLHEYFDLLQYIETWQPYEG